MSNIDVSHLDPTKLKDWQIAEEAEKQMGSIQDLAGEWGILPEELLLLLRFCSDYYHYPLGGSVFTALPAHIPTSGF